MTNIGEPRDTLAGSSVIDRKFKYQISKIPGGEKLLRCLQCGVCTATCPIASFSESYRPRRIIRMIQIGLKKQVLSLDALWLCASCFTCTDRCPQDVKVASVLRVLRNLAALQGTIPRVFQEIGSNILQTGFAYLIPKSRIQKRANMGLPLLPPGNPERLTLTLGNIWFPRSLHKEETRE